MENDAVEGTNKGLEDNGAKIETNETKQEMDSDSEKKLSDVIADVVEQQENEDAKDNEKKEDEVRAVEDPNNEEKIELGKDDESGIKSVIMGVFDGDDNEEDQKKEEKVSNEEKLEKQEEDKKESDNEENLEKTEVIADIEINSDDNSKDFEISGPKDKEEGETATSLSKSIMDVLTDQNNENETKESEIEKNSESTVQEREIKPEQEKDDETKDSKSTVQDSEIKSEPEKDNETKESESTVQESEQKEEASKEQENEAKKSEEEEKKEVKKNVLEISQSIVQEETSDIEEEEDTVMVTAMKSRPKIPIAQPLFSDQELEAAYKKLIAKKTLPPLEMRPSLVDYGRKQSVQHTILEEYDAAQADDNAVLLLQQSLHEDNRNFNSEQEKSAIKNRVEEVNNEERTVEERYKERLNQEQRNTNDKMNALLMKHEEQRKDFERRWTSEQAVLSFSKPSSQVLQLKRRQKAMALAHDFPRAKQFKIQAEKLQKEETQAATRLAEETMKKQYFALINTQQKEIECLKENRERIVTVIECQRDSEINSLENTKKQLYTRSTTMPKKAKVMLPQVTRDAQNYNSGIFTNRTRSHYANYKKTPELTKLDVKPLDFKKIIRPSTASPRKSYGQKY